MTDTKLGFVDQIKSFPRTFWVANTMEIFERLSWYGWFTVMGLYVTAPIAVGGLGFTTEVRGSLQGIVPFFLYLMPVLTGALADRFGFKKMFIIAFLVMIVSYYSLGQFTSLPTFFLAFMFVAVGAAIFKPVVVGTVARVTDERNSSMGFGIFYMMVNLGGFFGPVIAGVVRGWSWEYVFAACSGWAVINLIIVLTLYTEPPAPEGAEDKPKRSVLANAVDVLGNLRFFLTVGLVLIALMAANVLTGLGKDWFTWTHAGIFCVVWVVGNFLYDRVLPKDSGTANVSFIRQRMHCSNWRFALFLLIMSGFWTSFNQIFITMPEYIRDFTETRPLISAFETVFGESDPHDPDKGIASKIATISKDERAMITTTFTGLLASKDLNKEVLEKSTHTLLQGKIRMTPDQLKDLVTTSSGAVARLAKNATIAASLGRLTAIYPEDFNKPGNEPTEAELKKVDKAESAVVALLREHQGYIMQARLSVMVSEAKGNLGSLVTAVITEAIVTSKAIIQARQFNPEFIININAGGIVLFQIFVSFLMARFHRFTTMIVGMVVAGVGIGLSMFAGSEGMLGVGGLAIIVCLGLLIFSFGEMMASPTSQEYVGRIAPADKKALYMGYYFVAIALGNLFGGILSGEMYGTLARDMQRPDLMWAAFGVLMFFTAIIFVLYNRFALPKAAADSLTE